MSAPALAASPRPARNVVGRGLTRYLARFNASPTQALALLVIALLLIAFLVVPIVRVIMVAFTGPAGGFSLVHFGDFFRTGLLRESFWNSVYVGVMTVAVASLIAVPLATLLSRFQFRGAAIIHTLGVLPLVMPPFVGAIAMQLIYGRNGTINLLLDDFAGFKQLCHKYQILLVWFCHQVTHFLAAGH